MLRPLMSRQFGNPVGRLEWQSLENVDSVRVRIVPVDARRVQQANHGRGAFARTQAPGEQPVRASQMLPCRDRPEGAQPRSATILKHCLCPRTMSDCPICNRPHRVNPLIAWSSGALFPAKCKQCGGRFHPARLASSVLIELVLFPFGLFAGFTSGVVWVAALMVLGGLVAMLALRCWVPLVAAKT